MPGDPGTEHLHQIRLVPAAMVVTGERACA